MSIFNVYLQIKSLIVYLKKDNLWVLKKNSVNIFDITN